MTSLIATLTTTAVLMTSLNSNVRGSLVDDDSLNSAMDAIEQTDDGGIRLTAFNSDLPGVGARERDHDGFAGLRRLLRAPASVETTRVLCDVITGFPWRTHEGQVLLNCETVPGSTEAAMAKRGTNSGSLSAQQIADMLQSYRSRPTAANADEADGGVRLERMRIG